MHRDDKQSNEPLEKSGENIQNDLQASQGLKVLESNPSTNLV